MATKSLTQLMDAQREKLASKVQSARRLTPEEFAAQVEAKYRETSVCEPGCPLCGGSGYIRQDLDWNQPGFGQLEPCPNLAKRIVQKRIASGDARFGLTASEIASLNWKYILPAISDGPKAAQAILPVIEKGWGVVYLWGNPGQAKTLALKIAVAVALRNGKNAAYANLIHLLDDIRLAFDSDHQSTALVEKTDWWVGLDLLSLDELDKVNKTPWAVERLTELIDRRYTRAIRKEGITLIASNSPAEQLDDYIQSRIKDNRFSGANGSVVHLEGPDGRSAMTEEWTV